MNHHDEDVCFIAVHAGAGYHPVETHDSVTAACSQACQSVFAQTPIDSIAGCTAAIESLENDPATNAGFGSNLCLDESVQCDAGLMDGNSLRSGSVGAVKRILNPVNAAQQVLRSQLSDVNNAGLVPPNLLVGTGAEKFYTSRGFKLCNNYDLVSRGSLSQFRAALSRAFKPIPRSASFKSHLKRKRCNVDRELLAQRMDTVGGISLARNGDIAAGCSSGGLLLKQPGRLGQACLVGSGFWAEKTDKFSVGISLSGCGEYIQQTSLAREMSNAILTNQSRPDPEVSVKFVSEWFINNFTNSRLLKSYPNNHKVAGGIVVIFDRETNVAEFVWLHNTENLAVGYKAASSQDDQKKTEKYFISSLPSGIKPSQCPVVNAVAVSLD